MNEMSPSNTVARKEKLTYIEKFVDTWPFDKYPFQFLTMAVSLEAIFLSIFVLISQNRQAAKDRIKADLDYQVNVKTELELSMMAEHIHDIEQKLHHIHHDVLEASGGKVGA